MLTWSHAVGETVPQILLLSGVKVKVNLNFESAEDEMRKRGRRGAKSRFPGESTLRPGAGSNSRRRSDAAANPAVWGSLHMKYWNSHKFTCNFHSI
jgi:hypothetical protein